MSKATGRERRQSLRIELKLALRVRLGRPSKGPIPLADAEPIGAELIDAGEDGRGAAVLLPQGEPIPLGASIALLRSGQPDICGIIVSRMGMQARFRVGVRVNSDCQGLMQALVDAKSSGR